MRLSVLALALGLSTASATQYYDFTFITNGDFSKPEYAITREFFAYHDHPRGGIDYLISNGTTSMPPTSDKVPDVYFAKSVIDDSLLTVDFDRTDGKPRNPNCTHRCNYEAGLVATCGRGQLKPGQSCAVTTVLNSDGDMRWKYDASTHVLTNILLDSPSKGFFSCDYQEDEIKGTVQILSYGIYQDNGEPPKGCKKTLIKAFPRK